MKLTSFVAVFALLFAGVADACTGLYVGRKVSEDGSVLLGRTVDSRPLTICHRVQRTPRVENRPGRVYRSFKSMFRWALPATTWAYVSTPRMSSCRQGSFDSACVNEKGVAVSGTVTGKTSDRALKADPFVADGAAEENLPALLCQCSATAREAVELLGRVVAEKGHAGAEIYMVADADEAWYVEVYTGHQWAAVRMPEDCVACWGNQFMIRSFDPAAKDVLSSKGLVSVPEKAGFLVRGADGRPDLFRTYAQPLADYSNSRTWFGHTVLAPSTAGEYAVDRPMPLFYAPDRKVGLRDLFEIMRSRYEGTARCPETSGDHEVRVIGTTKQSTCHVLAVDPKLPAPIRCTLWGLLGNAEHALFLPLNAGVTRFDEAWSRDQRGPYFRYDPQLPACAFRRLSALAEQDRTRYGEGVRGFWRAREDQFLRDYPALLGRAAMRWATDPKGVSRDLTDWTVSAQAQAFADAKRLFDDLMWHVVDVNTIAGDNGGRAWWRPKGPYQPADRLRRKTKVLFFFDTEDFTCDRSNDAIRDIANILHDEGVRGHFALVAYLGQYFQEMKRQDVVDALRHHLVGSQTLYHSRHPNIVEYGDVADYAEAYARTMKEEKHGFDLIRQGTGAQKIWCSVFPGNANSYVGLYVHSQLGSPFFGGGNGSFTPGERQTAWFVNQYHLPYYKQLHLESFIPPRPPLDLMGRLDELATNEVVTLYMHPHMALSTVHWDTPNFNPKDPTPFGEWRPTPKRSAEDVAVYYDRLRAFVHALKTDDRFEVTDCERLYRSFRPRRKITSAELPAIREALLRRLAPVERPGSWCVADVFQAVVKLLRGEKSHEPGYVYGFLEPPKGVAAPVRLRRADLSRAAEKIDLATFLPAEIAVGAQTVGPADFLFAALDALVSGRDEVVVTPRDQLGPIGELMPSLATYSMKGGWPLYLPTFEDRYLTARLRLQLWTLRYEDL